LEMLYGDLPSMQRIIGLEELSKLKYVSVSQLRKTWFEKLPPSVERLFLRGSLDPKINLGNLPQLEYLGISNSRNLDFAKYGWVAHRIKRLDLTENAEVVNAEHLIKLTPNLSSLHYRGGVETYNHLCKSLKGFAEVIRLD
jgi:Leucine-rich repeat (LRR) protein